MSGEISMEPENLPLSGRVLKEELLRQAENIEPADFRLYVLVGASRLAGRITGQTLREALPPVLQTYWDTRVNQSAMRPKSRGWQTANQALDRLLNGVGATERCLNYNLAKKSYELTSAGRESAEQTLAAQESGAHPLAHMPALLDGVEDQNSRLGR